MQKKQAIWLIIFLNMVPFVGVLYWGWRVFDLMLLYWVENLFIGVFFLISVFLKVKADKSLGDSLGYGAAPFFAFHYGVFWLAHGVTLLMFFGHTAGLEFDFLMLIQASGYELNLLMLVREAFSILIESQFETQLYLAAVSLFLLHIFLWIRSYHKEDFYKSDVAGMRNLVSVTYKRVIVFHMFLLIGGWVAIGFGSPVFALVVFIVVKIISDIQHNSKSLKE